MCHILTELHEALSTSYHCLLHPSAAWDCHMCHTHQIWKWPMTASSHLYWIVLIYLFYLFQIYCQAKSSHFLDQDCTCLNLFLFASTLLSEIQIYLSDRPWLSWNHLMWFHWPIYIAPHLPLIFPLSPPFVPLPPHCQERGRITESSVMSAAQTPLYTPARQSQPQNHIFLNSTQPNLAWILD